MPLRQIGKNEHLRDPFRAADYTAPPRAVDEVREWYEGGRDLEERPRETPETYWVLRRWDEGGRTHVVLGGHDYLIEVSFVVRGGREEEPRVAAVEPERAYRLALDHDDELAAKGWTIHNERHRRP